MAGKENELQSVLLKNSILEKELLLLKQKVQLKKLSQPQSQPPLPSNPHQQSASASQPLSQMSSNILGPPIEFQSAKNRANSMRIENIGPSAHPDENKERRSSGLFLKERRY